MTRFRPPSDRSTFDCSDFPCGQYQNFGSLDEIWDANGRPVAELAKRPLRNGDNALGDDATGGPAASDTAKRNIGWLPGMRRRSRLGTRCLKRSGETTPVILHGGRRNG